MSFIKKKEISFINGFIKFARLEFYWGLQEWSLPLSVSFHYNVMFIGLLCFEISFKLTK